MEGGSVRRTCIAEEIGGGACSGGGLARAGSDVNGREEVRWRRVLEMSLRLQISVLPKISDRNPIAKSREEEGLRARTTMKT